MVTEFTEYSNPFFILQKEVNQYISESNTCLLYTSDAADERSSVDLGGRRIIKKKKKADTQDRQQHYKKKNIVYRVYRQQKQQTHKKS